MAKRSYPGQFGVAVGALEHAEKLQEENEALRKVLREQGLSDLAIQRRVNAYKRATKGEDSASRQFQRFLETIVSRLNEIDREQKLAILPIKGPRQ